MAKQSRLPPPLLLLLLVLAGMADQQAHEGRSLKPIELRGGGGKGGGGKAAGVGLLSSKGMQFRPLRREGMQVGGSRGIETHMMEDGLLLESKTSAVEEDMEERYDALWRAVKNSRVDLVSELIHKGLNLSHPDKSFGGWTSLHYAAAGGEGHVVDFLLSHGVPVDICNEQMSTPLAIAASEGHLSIVEKLLKRGADVNASNEHGMTALHR
eukprot:757162-Hanusia_phi.AAC.6